MSTVQISVSYLGKRTSVSIDAELFEFFAASCSRDRDCSEYKKENPDKAAVYEFARSVVRNMVPRWDLKMHEAPLTLSAHISRAMIYRIAPNDLHDICESWSESEW